MRRPTETPPSRHDAEQAGNRRGFGYRSEAKRADYARRRSAQITTANSAAPIRTTIEPTIVGSSGPFIAVKPTPISVIGDAMTKIRNG